MSTRDKTREKLLNSMRKTKEVINDQPDSKQAHAATYAPAAAKTSKSVKQAIPGKSKKIKKVPDLPVEYSSDPYQSRGRVWPD